MQTIYKQLTEEQKKKGVYFSSTLSLFKTEQADDIIHEVRLQDSDRKATIERLYDVSFFRNSHYKYHIIRK